MKKDAQSGFSLIEVVITIGILMSLTIAVASMLRAGFEVKAGLSQRAKVIHRLQVAINKVADDLQHVYFINPLTQFKNPTGRKMKTVFRIEKAGTSGDKLFFTTKTHRSRVAGAHEADTTYVGYELRDARDAPGRKHLYRAETPYIPEDLKEEPPMRLLARNIKNLTAEAWTGERWSKDLWDTGRGDTRNKLPKLVRITIEAWAEDRVEGDGQDETADQASELMSTVIFLQESVEYAELKQQDKTIKWGTF